MAKKKERRPRQDIKIERELVYKVGRKAFIDGAINRRITLIHPVIIRIMRMYNKGKLDNVLGERSARFLASKGKAVERYAVDKELKMEFEDRAVEEGKILRYCHARNLVEKLLEMYVNDEFKI